jgi:peptide/nickel transport system substrate-binding protein
MDQMKKRWSFGLSLVMAAAIVLAGCNKSDTEANTGIEGGEKEKVLTFALAKDISSFDVQNYSASSLEAVHVNMYSHLLKNDAKQNKVPDLATSWEKRDDKTWRFKLRQGVKFHNGDPFTAADVKYTLERVAKDPKIPDNANYKMITEVKIIDEYTVDILTEYPDPLILNRLARVGSYIMPAKYIQEKGWDYYLNNPVGTGPYKFSSWKKDDRVELVKNPDYFGDKPKWDKLIVRSIPDEST